MANVIAVLIILILIGCALAYIIRKKKNGARCIGCPDSDQCCACHGAEPGCGYQEKRG